MRIRVLGAAAGGGFPQWNCNCRNCAGVREGSVRALARTQSSIAVSDGSGAWVLCNASPDILRQIQSFPELQPGRAVRDTGIAGVVLVDGQIDHSTGLLFLREHRARLQVWCADPVYEDLTTGHPLLRTLEHYCGVVRHPLPLDGSAFTVPQVPGVEIAALALASKAAPYSPHRHAPQPGDNAGLRLRDAVSGRRAFYAPGLGEIGPDVWEAMRTADCVLVDGTFWSDDEMIALGFSGKRARDIGHLPQSGAGGMIEWLGRLPQATRKVLIHINNTNPILDEDSAERAQLAAAGIEVACDGMEIVI